MDEISLYCDVTYDGKIQRTITPRRICTRAEVWAAIEEWVNEAGCVCDDLTYTTARLAPLRQRVRDLLGMEEG